MNMGYILWSVVWLHQAQTAWLMINNYPHLKKWLEKDEIILKKEEKIILYLFDFETF